MDQTQADFRCHDGDAADLVLHHSFCRFTSAARVVVGIAQNGVIAKLSRADLKALDHFGKEWILNVGNNDSQRAAVANRKISGVHIRYKAESPHGRKDPGMRLPANLPG